MLDIPQAGFVIPKEEINKAALLQIMVSINLCQQSSIGCGGFGS